MFLRHVSRFFTGGIIWSQTQNFIMHIAFWYRGTEASHRPQHHHYEERPSVRTAKSIHISGIAIFDHNTFFRFQGGQGITATSPPGTVDLGLWTNSIFPDPEKWDNGLTLAAWIYLSNPSGNRT